MGNRIRNHWEQLAFAMEEVFLGHEIDAIFLDDKATALLGMLEQLTAAEASYAVCGSSVVSHVRHVLFSVSAYRDAIRQDDPDFIANGWPEWDETEVTHEEWQGMMAELPLRIAAFLKFLQVRTEAGDRRYLSALGALGHMAFHLGAIQVKYDMLKASS